MHRHFRRQLILGLEIIAGSVLIFGAGLYLLADDLENKSEKIVTARALISQTAATIEALADLKNDAPKADAYRRAIDKILVSQDRLLDFPRWLEGLARGRKVALTFSFQGSQVKPLDNAPGHIGFSLDIRGALANLTEFLKDVEFQSPRFLVSLDNFNLNGSGSSYRITSQGKVYFR